jgi:tRNA uridine 5-carboxymethylaminomethyl modification enzyme
METIMKNNVNNYELLVIGAGHAGIEAAAAAARMNIKVGLITIKEDNIGHMPCNPAIGGIGKGHIVFEISALGGIMPELCSESYLQANMLNMSKGPAVQGLRLQIDKAEYKKKALAKMQQYPNITIIYNKVETILVENKKIIGLRTIDNQSFFASAVIVTSGTFLNGLIHMGLTQQEGGRLAEENSKGLSPLFTELGLTLGRLKTGTPARIDEKSINFTILEEQTSHNLDGLFCYNKETVTHKKSCYVTYTNKNTHDIILANAHLSPIYRGDIHGVAPRYCPSIEDKIKRFAHKESHHIFIEPEGLLSTEWYPNGLSTSLPVDVQEKFLRTIKGFENIIITKPGYAIEYDFIHPNQLHHTLECKTIENLYFAGQINGTTGYEEAAGQGIIAGINAAAKIKHLAPFILSRQESYIGIMIDDLITLGVDEPYRMFTSRAERRLLLRQDNTFYRLSHYAKQYNLISDTLFNTIEEEYNLAQYTINTLSPQAIKISQYLSANNHDVVKEIILAQAPLASYRMREYIFAELLYKPYYARELQEIKKMQDYQTHLIPALFNYNNIPGLSIELQQKLTKYKPATIAQATLIQGMTPAAISLLLFKIKQI